MLEQLQSAINEVGALHSKLVLLTSSDEAFRSQTLADLAQHRGAAVLNVGKDLSARMASLPSKHRALAAPDALRELADQHTSDGLVLLDNIEVLFDPSLRLDPLILLRQLARVQRVVAAWPGQIRDGRLVYAELGHPEHRDYAIDGLVPVEIP